MNSPLLPLRWAPVTLMQLVFSSLPPWFLICSIWMSVLPSLGEPEALSSLIVTPYVDCQGGREAGMQRGRDAGMQGGRDAGRQGGREAGRQGCRDDPLTIAGLQGLALNPPIRSHHAGWLSSLIKCSLSLLPLPLAPFSSLLPPPLSLPLVGLPFTPTPPFCLEISKLSWRNSNSNNLNA